MHWGHWEETFTPSTLGLLAIGVALSVLLWRRRKIENLPPGPVGWPLLGNLPSLGFHSEWVVTRWNQKYGPVCRLTFGRFEVVVLGSLEVVQEAFLKKGEIYSNRLQNSVPPMFGDKGILFVHYEEKFKEQRRFGLSTLREFGMGRKSIEPNMIEVFSELCDRIKNSCDEGQAFNIDKMIYEAVSAVISKMVFNRNLPAENEQFRKLLHHLADVDEHSIYNGHIPPFSQCFETGTVFDNDMTSVIKEQVDEHRKTKDKDDPRDVIDCFLNEMDALERRQISTEGEGVLVDTSFVTEQLVKLVRDLFLAGSETTSTTFYWMLLYVGLDPSIQDEMYNEIMRVLGEDVSPTMSKTDELPYVRAVIQETLRLRPIAPLGVPHVVTKDDELLGYKISKGSVVLANLFGIHHDEALWPDAERFDPRRHLGTDGAYIKSPHVIPFSSGLRECLGKQLANMELFLMTVMVFQHFSFELVDADKVDIRGKNIFSLRPNPYKVIARRR